MAEWLRERTWAESPDSNRELFADVRTGPHTSALHPFEEPGESALRTTASPDKRTANGRRAHSRTAHQRSAVIPSANKRRKANVGSPAIGRMHKRKTRMDKPALRSADIRTSQ